MRRLTPAKPHFFFHALCLALCAVGSAGCGDGGGPVHATETRGATNGAADDRAAIRVRVETVRLEPIAQRPEATGMVRAFRETKIAAEVVGRVIRRSVEPGDAVERDQVIVELDASRLALAVDEARATLQAREVDLSEARAELERGDQLIRGNSISDQQRDALRFAAERAESAWALAAVAVRAAERTLADSHVRAPFTGTLESVSVHVGDYLVPGTPIATLFDLASVRIVAGVTAAEAAALSRESIATVSFAELGGFERRGEVKSVGRVADPASGTYPVELWIDNRDDQLRVGMVTSVQFATESDETYAVIPRAALIRRDGQLSVFVIVEDEDGTRAVLRRARIGRSSPQTVELLEGAEIGERVVVEGLFALRDGARVSVEADLASNTAGPEQ
ncbi:MAG: efflux RND transporter periplasmic adaptor subunit [Myxococcales bacterium]|nr:efflux RND transporter periplasmic adaptor subunit [Myxococcales bacterium]